MKGCKRVGFAAAERSRNAALMTCGPAFNERRIWPRSSISSPSFVMLTRFALKSAFAAQAERMDALAVDGVLDLVLVFQAACHAEIGAEHSHGEDIVAVKRKRDFG